MTITKPTQKIPHKKFLLLLAIFVCAGGGAYVFEYNGLAEKRDEVRRIKEDIVKEKLNEADFKHVVFEKTDPKKLQEAALRRGLEVEAKPKYVYIGGVETKSVVLAE